MKLLLWPLLLLVLTSAPAAAPPDATEIVRRADAHLRGESSQATFSMKIVRPDWSRQMRLKFWSKGSDYALILVTSPARDRGTTFLLRKNEVWNYRPDIERVIKLPPSMMSQSWMGSDFTNDDLVKESSIVKDYRHEVVGDTTIAGREAWKIRLMPKPEAAVVWGKVHLWVAKGVPLQLRAEYFDEDGVLVNVMEMSEIREIGGRLLPTRMEMRPADEEGHLTVMTYEEMAFDIDIDEGFFSQRNMKRVRP